MANSFLVSGNILSSADYLCKQFGPDQDPQTAGSDLSPPFETLIVFLKELSEKDSFEKSQQTTMKA